MITARKVRTKAGLARGLEVDARRVTSERYDPGSRSWVLLRARNNSGVYIDEQTALTYSAVWRAINLLSFGCALLRWGVYRKLPGENGREEFVDDDAAWMLQGQFGPDMQPVNAIATMMAHTLTGGNGYAELEKRINGNPLAGHMLTPDRVTPRRDPPTGTLFYEVTNDSGGVVNVPAQNMIHFHGLAYDGLVGYNPMRLFANTIGLSLAAERYGSGFFGSGAAPSGVLSTDKDIAPEKMTKIKERIQAEYVGPDAAGSVMVLEDGLKWSGVSLAPDTAQFIETRRFQVSDVSRIYGVPEHMLGELGRSTNNNIEQQASEFVMWGLMPWVKVLEDELTWKLLGERRMRQGHYVRANVKALLRADTKTQGEFLDKCFKMAVYSVNDIRELLELNPVKGGDLRLVPLNMVPLEQAKDVPMEKRQAAGKSDKPEKDAPPGG